MLDSQHLNRVLSYCGTALISCTESWNWFDESTLHEGLVPLIISRVRTHAMVSLNPLTLAGVEGHAAHCRARIYKPPVSMETATYEIDKFHS